MKFKQRIQIDVGNKDVFGVLTSLKKQAKVFTAHVVNNTAIVVNYDARKTNEEEILKLTGGKLTV